MPPTYTPNDAITLVRKYCRDVPVTAIDSQECDIVNGIMWRFYPWRWTQAALTAIAMVNGQQDYTIANSDFYRPIGLRLVRTDPTPDEILPPLNIKKALEPNLIPMGYTAIQEVAVDAVTGKLRLDSAISITTEVVQLQGEYQKLPTLINDAALGTAFAFPDVYLQVFVEGLKWRLYYFVDDPRAGAEIVAKSGQRQYTGQLGVFMGALQQMAADEDYSDEQNITPETPMGVSCSYDAGW